MKNKEFPNISFIICTLNCRDDLEKCLKSIRKQNYPQKKVEIIVVDSYSDDGTLDVAKKYNSKIILTKVRGYMEGKGMPKSIGCENAKGDIIITIDSDNELVENSWIKNMIYPLQSNKKIDFCISRMEVNKSDPLINQYLSYVGTDPFAIYTSIDPQLSLKNLKLKDYGKYYSYNLSGKNFLIAGGYYLTFRRETLKEIGGYSRDVDVVYTLSSLNKANVAIPKNTHLHHSMTKSFISFFTKKIKWGKYYFSNSQKDRKFNWSAGIFGRNGKIRFYTEVLKSLFILPEIFISLKMYFTYNLDKSWLLHAPMRFATTFAYIIAFIKTR
jgi:glycosyltransferase involved in cell wall biosynthesis